ncbi:MULTISPECIES: D-alanyl-D-alanine carboxypeptidase family protein [Clostridium]|uniref:D-alanyl-D-alanine carboxypeptidase family protein n=1 Tax=Clostridium TaxID=1485 RepID=UPI0005EAE677|nr:MULTISPECIES: D-alanyl-D-alanine carboxypeptidase family protein [Clostridium]MBS4840345.1 D-alanyl-D-alanine carboxypeptidase [Clostridium sp.]MDU1400292.1 D-alanyl-D-alanine carboxypeptidase family protein [Clostridium sp.]MDU1602459.1 D-alanyl-D-alanine carboxypeptidase family protein [Clostridium sp.]MDU2893521.1 D-alanyl-D-alanine carboxypeptidase family protein [Clostridium sp.]MDU3006573.1 D-alanyl-D-alanine carboxypeptidase family protein [Clostridium sp.]
MKKGIKISSILLLCSLFVQILSVDAYGYINYGNISYSYNEKSENKNLRVNARCAIALDKESHQVLYEQNAYEIVPMASTTKILTSLIAIEQDDLNAPVTISKKASSIRGSKVGYKENEVITLKELIFGLMFKSGNDAAIAIAEHIGGSVEGFAEIMNHYARGIGILDSHFESPHGLDSSQHYSSAYDLALLTCKGMDYDLFREVVGSKSISKDKYNFTRDYNNINKILWKIPGANGVKTGYTGQAGKCLVSSVNNNNKDIIIVVLNCPDRWNVTDKIYQHVQETVAFGSHNVKDLVYRYE